MSLFAVMLIAGACRAASPAAHTPKWQSPPFDFKATGLAVADFAGDGTLQAAVSSEGEIDLYPYPLTDAKPLAVYTPSGGEARFLSLDAAPTATANSGAAKALLIAVRFDRLLGRLETDILKFEGGAWHEAAEIPGAVRRYQDEAGAPKLAVQELIEDSAFPFSPIHPMTLGDGRYQVEKSSLRPPGGDWLYDFTMAPSSGAEASWLVVTGDDRLEISTGKSRYTSEQPVGRTPLRLRWQKNTFEFHPAMPVVSEQGRPVFYLTDNLPLWGSSIAAAFGRFHKAQIEKASFDGEDLTTLWEAQLDAYVPAVALVNEGPAAGRGLLAVGVSSGRSRLYLYEP